MPSKWRWSEDSLEFDFVFDAIHTGLQHHVDQQNQRDWEALITILNSRLEEFESQIRVVENSRDPDRTRNLEILGHYPPSIKSRIESIRLRGGTGTFPDTRIVATKRGQHYAVQ